MESLRPITRTIKINLAMQSFGMLIAIKPMGVDKHGRILWLCQCDCGKRTIARGSHLKNGNTQSCGCLIGKHTKKMWGDHKDKYDKIESTYQRYWREINSFPTS